MSETDSTTRTVVSPSTGARIGLMIALTVLVGAAYLLWSPIQLYPADGFPTKCGMAAAPPSDDLGRAICGDIHVIRQWQAGSLAVIAAVIALGSFYAFGVNRRDEPLLGSEDRTLEAEPGTEESSTEESSDATATTGSPRSQPTDSAAS